MFYDTCLIGISIGIFLISMALTLEIYRQRRQRKMEEMRLKCDNCGAILRQPEISHDLYGNGKDRQFGKCPRCRGIGKFKIKEEHLKGLFYSPPPDRDDDPPPPIGFEDD